MHWVLLSFASAFLLGCYEVSKKMAVQNNAVIPVLFLNTLFGALLLCPLVIASRYVPDILNGTPFFVPTITRHEHAFMIIKSLLVSTAWLLGFFAIKHLPLTIVGPITATGPVLTLVGAMLVFGERLNAWQWAGVALTVISFFLLSASGKKEGITFSGNKWILFLVLSVMFSCMSGLYDRFLMLHVSPTAVQFWSNVYLSLVMLALMVALWMPERRKTTRFQWRWSIFLIALFLACADFIYFYALSDRAALISVVSMIRRSNVIVTFIAGAWLFGEHNLRGKALDLLLILVAMLMLWMGTR
ncbi:MAG: DMT family transporter [Bacteroidales bacterium]|jgi:transporter family protein|nr:DMT family transporter [Bacteroidales bacterium]